LQGVFPLGSAFTQRLFRKSDSERSGVQECPSIMHFRAAR
jgi:hypothetical protein